MPILLFTQPFFIVTPANCVGMIIEGKEKKHNTKAYSLISVLINKKKRTCYSLIVGAI
jgi:hypothetical protein